MNKLIKYFSILDLCSIGFYLISFVLFYITGESADIMSSVMIVSLIVSAVFVVTFLLFSVFGLLSNKIQTNKLFFITHIINCLWLISFVFSLMSVKILGEPLVSFIF